jgi:outer membrane protein OmpA-like peptidoglycan-associated protein
MQSPNVPRRRGSHIAMGLALLVMGYAVLVIAFARQAERNRAPDLGPACVGSSEMTHALPPASAEPGVASTAARPDAATNAPTDGGSSRDSSTFARNLAGSLADTSADGLDAGDRIFGFYAGGLAMSKEERQRVYTLGLALARQPELKVTVDGYGDIAGTDPATVAMARHRAKVGQVLLVKAGVAETRVILTVGEAPADSRLLRSIRITTAPLEMEAGQP